MRRFKIMHTLYDQIKLEYTDLSSNITNLLNTIREKSDLEFKPITSNGRRKLYISVHRGNVIQEYKLPELIEDIIASKLPKITNGYSYMNFLSDLNIMNDFFIYIKRAGYFGPINLFTPEFEYVLNAHRSLKRILRLLDEYVGNIDE